VEATCKKKSMSLLQKMSDQTFSTLELIGGTGTDCQQGLKPDLFVYGGAKITKGLCVGSDLKIKGNTILSNITPTSSGLKIEGNVCISGSLTVLGNTIIADADTEYTRLASFDLVLGNVIIEPTIELNPSTISIVNLPCSGILAGLNPVTGEVEYVPDGNIATPILDIYQYQGLDYDGMLHLVTQLVCSRATMVVPPFANDDCISLLYQLQTNGAASGLAGVYESNRRGIGLSVIEGTYPIDWSTFTILSAVTFTDEGQCLSQGCQYFRSINYGSGINMCGSLTGPGTFVGPSTIIFNSSFNSTTFTFEVNFLNPNIPLLTLTISSPGDALQCDYGFKYSYQVADINGNLSNIGTLIVCGLSCI
jgi:hypothetical protein